MGGKMNLSKITKTHATDPEKGSRKIDFKALWPRKGHTASVEVKFELLIWGIFIFFLMWELTMMRKNGNHSYLTNACVDILIRWS